MPATAAGRAVLKNEHLYFYKSHTDDAGARRSVSTTGGAETRTPGQQGWQPTVEIYTILNELQLWGEVGQEEVHLSDHIPLWRALARNSWLSKYARITAHLCLISRMDSSLLAVICWINWVTHLDLPLDQDPPCLPSPLRHKPVQIIKSNLCFETAVFNYLWFHLGPLFHNGPLYLSDL